MKGIFTLTDLQAQLSAFAFFIAYGRGVVPGGGAARPAARGADDPARAGDDGARLPDHARRGQLAVYSLVLLGLFVLASGITILQVAANPLAAALGDPKGSHFRLTLSQTFNSFGTFIGPLLGAALFLEGVEVKEGPWSRPKCARPRSPGSTAPISGSPG